MFSHHFFWQEAAGRYSLGLIELGHFITMGKDVGIGRSCCDLVR